MEVKLMPSYYWNKQEREIFDQHFLTMDWEEFKKFLPNKTTAQILNRGSKLGLEREEEDLGIYYDDDKKAWIEKKRSFTGNYVCTISNIYPAPKNVTIEQCKKAVMKNFTDSFFEHAIKRQYLEMLDKVGIKHDDDLFNLFWEVRYNAFWGQETPDLSERLEKILKEKLKERI
jgi:hypothetical protein